MTDRARPGLVALYDIRPGNGAGQFLQPRSPHGALEVKGFREGSATRNHMTVAKQRTLFRGPAGAA